MKIISKFKDYYDFLQGKYGTDPLKILDRTTCVNISPYDTFEFIFCNTTYKRILLIDYYGNTYNKYRTNNYYKKVHETNKYVWLKTKATNNEKEPIVYISHSWNRFQKDYKENKQYNFSLKNIGFNEVLTPDECYLKIEEFLGKVKNEKPQTIPTDLDRFEAKGFDRKTSFRNM